MNWYAEGYFIVDRDDNDENVAVVSSMRHSGIRKPLATIRHAIALITYAPRAWAILEHLIKATQNLGGKVPPKIHVIAQEARDLIEQRVKLEEEGQ